MNIYGKYIVIQCTFLLQIEWDDGLLTAFNQLIFTSPIRLIRFAVVIQYQHYPSIDTFPI